MTTSADCDDTCLVCQVLATHPRWLVADSTTPPEWRFGYFVTGMYGAVDRDAVIEATRAYAHHHGDAAVVRAIKRAQSLVSPHGYSRPDVMDLLDKILDGLMKRGVRG